MRLGISTCRRFSMLLNYSPEKIVLLRTYHFLLVTQLFTFSPRIYVKEDDFFETRFPYKNLSLLILRLFFSQD